MWDAYVFEKCMYKKWKNILLMYRGLLFLLESEFETFMNVIFLKQIIQGFWTEHLSEEIVDCLIIAGMILTVTKIWKAFVQERDFSRNIVESIEKAKGKTSKKTEASKNKKVITKAKKTVAKKSSKFSKKTASRTTEKSMILKK